jgi:sec-independent protein translocase protein TatA
MGLMPLGIGPLEIVIVLIIVLVIFGPKRLPDLGRSLGKGMREFKESVTGKDQDELPPSPDNTGKPEPVAAEPTEQKS